MPNGLRPTDGRHEGSRVPARPVPEQHAPAQQVLGLLLTLKLASLIVVGVLLSVAGVIAGHAVASMSGEMMDSETVLSPPAATLADTPAWGVLAGVPAIACGAIGLLNRIGTRRSAWLWAALGTFALAGAVIGLGVVVFGSMIALQDQLLPA
jgi:hypothetical protein